MIITVGISDLTRIDVIPHGRAEKAGDEGHEVMILGRQASGGSGRVVTDVRGGPAVELVVKELLDWLALQQVAGGGGIGDAAQQERALLHSSAGWLVGLGEMSGRPHIVVRADVGRGRHPRPDEYGLQLQRGGDALHEFFANGAGRHLCEDGAQFSDELVFAFGAAEVRAIEVLLDVEALERVRAGDERADGFSALAAEQISGVAAGGQRRDEQSQARWAGDLAGTQDRLGAGVVAVKHEHDRRCESLERTTSRLTSTEARRHQR